MPADAGAALRPLVGRVTAAAGDLRAALPAVVFAVLAAGLVILGGYHPQHADQASAGRLFQLLAAAAAFVTGGLLVLEPWLGLVAWVLAMPLLSIARAQLVWGPLQVILTTVLVAALAVGWAVRLVRRQTVTLSAAPGESLPAAPVALASAGSARFAVPAAAAIVAALVVLAALSTAASPDPAGGLPIALHGLVEPAVLGLLVVALRPTRRQLGALGLAMGLSVAFASAFNLYRMSTLAHTLAELEVQRIQLARLTYFNVGLFAGMLAMSLPFVLLGLVLYRRLPGRRLALLALLLALLVSLAGLYLAFSKSGWLAALVACLLFLLVAVGTWKARLGLGLLVLAVSALVVPWPLAILQAVAPGGADTYRSVITATQGQNRAASWDPSTAEGEVSISERWLATRAGLQMAVDHPLLGVGPGRFGTEYATAYHPAGGQRNLGSAHDFLPNLAAEFGLLAGALVGLALLAALLLWARAVALAGGDERLVAAAFGTALVGFAVVGVAFGLDLYRAYRVMDSDMLFGALLVAAALAFTVARPGAGRDARRATAS